MAAARRVRRCRLLRNSARRWRTERHRSRSCQSRHHRQCRASGRNFICRPAAVCIRADTRSPSAKKAHSAPPPLLPLSHPFSHSTHTLTRPPCLGRAAHIARQWWRPPVPPAPYLTLAPRFEAGAVGTTAYESDIFARCGVAGRGNAKLGKVAAAAAATAKTHWRWLYKRLRASCGRRCFRCRCCCHCHFGQRQAQQSNWRWRAVLYGL